MNEPAKQKDPKRVAAGRKSKNKGNTFQREVAKSLSKWSGATFKATPRSGGLRWGGAFWTYGDLTPPEDFFAVFECKHYHEIEFLDVLGTTRSPQGAGLVHEWWNKEARVDAARAARELGRPFAAFLVWKADHARHRISMLLDHYNRIPQRLPLATLATGCPGFDPYVTADFESFLGSVDFVVLRELLRQGMGEPVPPVNS